MAKREQSNGKCHVCQAIMTRRKLFNHLEKCIKRHEAIELCKKSKRSSQKLFHVRASVPHSLDFWLDLEVNGSARLADLDKYLREIWLECCEHLSEFSRGDFFNDELSMSLKIEDIFKKEKVIYHVYDFGTTSETLVDLISVREGQSLSKNPMFLMSRNEMLDEKCIECKSRATYFCIGCLYEGETGGVLCDKHTEKHPHGDNYGDPVPLVNSPRLGMCGYEGPADPPY